MQVEHVDFVSFLTEDISRAKRFYTEVLGLEVETEGEHDLELRAGQVTLDIFDPSSIGQPFAASPAGLAGLGALGALGAAGTPAAGVAVAYFSFGHALVFLQAIGGHSLIAHYNPNQYLGLFMMMMFIFGITFEFPVVLVALELARVVTPAQLLRVWRYALIAITIASAVFTPSGDPLSMLALAAPLTLFYFLSIGVGKLLRR